MHFQRHGCQVSTLSFIKPGGACQNMHSQYLELHMLECGKGLLPYQCMRVGKICQFSPSFC